MRGLQGKNVVLTGGASGIGQAISLRLGEEGCNVGIFDLNGDGANGVVEKSGPQAEQPKAIPLISVTTMPLPTLLPLSKAIVDQWTA